MRRLWRAYIRFHAQSFYNCWGSQSPLRSAEGAWGDRSHWLSRWYWSQVHVQVVNINFDAMQRRKIAADLFRCRTF